MAAPHECKWVTVHTASGGVDAKEQRLYRAAKSGRITSKVVGEKLFVDLAEAKAILATTPKSTKWGARHI